MKNHEGSTFDDFLEEEGILAEVHTEAIKRVVAWHLQQYMETEHLTKKALAAQMHTSRSALDRLLDPENLSVTLSSLVSAVTATGKRLEVNIA